MLTLTHEECAARFARKLREHFPTAKHLAQAADCHPDHAAELMDASAPRLPAGRIMVNLARALGDEFVQYVYAPATGWQGADDMQRKLDAARAQLDEIQRSIELRVPSSSLPEGRAAHRGPVAANGKSDVRSPP